MDEGEANTAWRDSDDSAWDSYQCHMTDVVEDTLSVSNTVATSVPGGCTKILQPADVSWSAPFKNAYWEQYDCWMAQKNRPITVITPAGNPHAPSKALMVKWVLTAW